MQQQIVTNPIRPGRFPGLARLRGAAMPVVLLTAMAMTALPAAAQSLFSPAIRVNDEVITHYELEQRRLFIELLRIPGDPDELARKVLIEERLKQKEISDAGISVGEDAIKQGIQDLSSRTDLTPDEFVQALGQGGVSPETLRDFIRNGIAWRDYVTQRFLSVARPTQAEIDRALSQSGSGGVQVLLSEIIMPVTPDNIEQVDAVAAQIAQIKTQAEFADAAARFSATDTRDNGGRLDWLPVTQLPPGLQPVILELQTGEVSAPISLPNAVALFQMRGIREVAPGTPRYSEIDYAAYYIAGGRTPEALASARRISDEVDICNDLYGIAQGQPPEVLDRQSLPPGQIPQDVALELAKLDPGEISTALTRNGGTTLVLLMLCSRTAAQAGDAINREEVANALTQQRLNIYAESHLQKLLAEARIVEE